jgi:hypothetical protein
MAKLSRRGIKSNPAPKLPVNSAQGKYVLSVLGCRSLGSGKKSTPPQCETRREKQPGFGTNRGWAGSRAAIVERKSARRKIP